jgi:site-specific DNA-cytosine methylase
MLISVATALSLCDGMSCAAISMKANNFKLDRYLAVEIDEDAKRISQAANPKTECFPGIDHSWHSDVSLIKEQDIRDLGAGNIKILAFGAPCEDMSKLRLIVRTSRKNRRSDRKIDPRPGLDGPKGKVFRSCIQVLVWVLKHNPDCEFICENVKFDDMPEDWDEICKALGTPLIINAQDYSHTKRVRAYWGNFLPLQIQLPPPVDLDPNQCMSDGRILIPYTACGRDNIRPIGKSWRSNGEANTSRPVLVFDPKYDKPQHLYPLEAELLMGHEANITACPGTTDAQRLKAIGNGWDVNVTNILFSYSKLANNLQPADVDQLADIALTLQSMLVADHQRLGSQDFSQQLLTHDPHHVRLYLQLLTSYYAEDSSVLDSGSAKHLQSATCVTDQDALAPLTGFNGSTEWTEGNGYLPLEIADEHTGQRVPIDVLDTDLMTGLASQILSLGKLLRAGWDFHFTDHGTSCHALTPGGAHKVKVELCTDDILRIKHKHRTGAERLPLPTQPTIIAWQCNTLRRSASDATQRILHSIFNHSNVEKLYQTLVHTRGYSPQRFEKLHCDVCARTKAQSMPLRQKAVQPALSMPVHNSDPVFDDTDNSGGESSDDFDDDEYVSPVAGRRLGIQPVPRFDLEALKPYEVMFVDNKDFPCAVRGGAITALVFICHKTRIKQKVDLSSKKHNGTALRRIVSQHGVHKLPYRCRVYSDGCGSMKHVELMCERFGIDHQYIPPHQQSLNEAEKVCDYSWAAARAHMDQSRAPDHWFSKAVDFALYTDARTATTANRGWLTPFELARGIVPSIAKLHMFWTRCYVTVPKSKRKQLAARGLHNVRAEPGRLVGWQGLFSSTYAVLLDAQYEGQQDRLVHSIDVTFNDADFIQAEGERKYLF